MMFLIDQVPKELARRMQSSKLIRGQLMTPGNGFSDWGGEYAIDNGAFSKLDRQRFLRLLERQKNYGQERISDCLFIACPDVVGSFRRTLEIWKLRQQFFCDCQGFAEKFALVAQDGAEDHDIPWSEFETIFIGGGDPWKDSSAAIDIVKTAKALGKKIHVGRVNTPKRYDLFAKYECDTCDGSGVARYDWMLDAIENRSEPQKSLFDATGHPVESDEFEEAK